MWRYPPFFLFVSKNCNYTTIFGPFTKQKTAGAKSNQYLVDHWQWRVTCNQSKSRRAVHNLCLCSSVMSDMIDTYTWLSKGTDGGRPWLVDPLLNNQDESILIRRYSYKSSLSSDTAVRLRSRCQDTSHLAQFSQTMLWNKFVSNALPAICMSYSRLSCTAQTKSGRIQFTDAQNFTRAAS